MHTKKEEVMPSAAADVAAQFIDLYLKYKPWKGIRMLPEGEMKVLFDLVSAAGFSPKEVIVGKLVGQYLEQDGRSTGETYPINSLCPFKVVAQEGGDDYFATGWLECVFWKAADVLVVHSKDLEKRIELLAREVERSVPLEPIQLTSQGDLLREYPPRPLAFGLQYFVDHTRDDHPLGSCVGIHAHCRSWMDRMRVTSTHDAIVCRGCPLRVLFPREVTTYGELRQALAPGQAQASA